MAAELRKSSCESDVRMYVFSNVCAGCFRFKRFPCSCYVNHPKKISDEAALKQVQVNFFLVGLRDFTIGFVASAWVTVRTAQKLRVSGHAIGPNSGLPGAATLQPQVPPRSAGFEEGQPLVGEGGR